ncbi:CRAL/TRIO domain-containing protein [Xylariaceae sp. FL1651]|nr:CRAL/TRIO domain-containing protein [Xylariaceae sp. FL1651]
MAVGSLASGSLGNLTPNENQKLQRAWIHLLRLCGIKNFESALAPDSTPDISSELMHHLHDTSSESFRRNLWGFILAEHPDSLILRFLRARKWDVEKAMIMLVSAINWRDEIRMAETVIHDGENVGLKENPSADDQGFIAQYCSGKSYVRGTDKENRLIYVIRVWLHDPRVQSMQAMESYVLHNIESLRILVKPPNDKCCLIFDMTGFGLKNMDFHIVKFLVSVFEARYPETLGLVLIHNAPFGWLDPVIASKINFTRKPADLLRFISEESLQTSYGGKDSWEYTYVEPVPGENARLEKSEKRREIQKERNELICDFERVTAAWASLEPESPAGNEKGSRRSELADQLSVSYWKLDPYIRAKTYYHRVGMLNDI